MNLQLVLAYVFRLQWECNLLCNPPCITIVYIMGLYHRSTMEGRQMSYRIIFPFIVLWIGSFRVFQLSRIGSFFNYFTDCAGYLVSCTRFRTTSARAYCPAWVLHVPQNKCSLLTVQFGGKRSSLQFTFDRV